MSVKEQVPQAIHHSPEDVDYRDISDKIVLPAAVREAEDNIDKGRLVSNDQMKARIIDLLIP